MSKNMCFQFHVFHGDFMSRKVFFMAVSRFFTLQYFRIFVGFRGLSDSFVFVLFDDILLITSIY